MKQFLKWMTAVIAATALAGMCFLLIFVRDENVRFVSAGGEEELVEALIENFSTGQESVIVRMKDFKIDRDRLSSYISSEISNDSEDLCIMPTSYTVSMYDFANLWKFQLHYTGVGEGKDDAMTSYTLEEVESAQTQVSAALDEIVLQIRSEGGADEIALHRAIFEYLCENVSYDTELSDVIIAKDEDHPLRKNRGCYGALIQKKTVCSGYAGAYKAICDRLGLDCWIAESVDHAWNLVRLKDGQIFCVDATSGDQDTWIADQFFMISPEEYEGQYGYYPSGNSYIPERFRK